MKSICITGPRIQTLNTLMRYGDMEDERYYNLGLLILSAISDEIKQGYKYFRCGGALGIDLDCVEVITQIYNKSATIEVVIPCNNQDKFWNEEDKKRYQNLLLEENVIIKKFEGDYTPECMQRRNEYMVDCSDKVLAFWHGEKKGGTWNTIQYAIKQKKNIKIINLNDVYKSLD